MLVFLLTVHILVAIGLVGVILVQRSEGGALGIGGSGGMGGFLAGRATANLLTRTTAVLAVVFILTSLALGKLASAERQGGGLFGQPPAASGEAPPPAGAPAPDSPPASAPASPPASPETAPPAAPAQPAAPIAR